MENQRNQQGEMVDNQTANKTNKHLKKRKKKSRFRSSRISVLVLVLLHQHPVLFVCISYAALEPASGGAGALLLFQCNMVWRSFVWPGGSGFQSFVSSFGFFSVKCGSSRKVFCLVR
jgi:hypothetical protein